MTSDTPMFSYSVCLPDGSRTGSWRFKLSEGALVQDLEEEIHKKWGHKQALKGYDLSLLKCDDLFIDPEESFHERGPKWLREHSSDAPMQPTKALSRYFPLGPAPVGEEKVDVVVASTYLLEAPDKLHALPINNASNISKERVALATKIGTLPSPSACVSDVNGIARCNDENRGIHAHRPATNHGPPTILFNRVLARLKYLLDHLDELEELEPSSHQLLQCHKFIVRAREIYKGETLREEALKLLIEEFLGGICEWQYRLEDKVAKVDCVLRGRDGVAIRLIFELKNEDGLGGNSSLQGVASFAKIVSQAEYEQYVANSNCPVIIIGMMGPRLEISTAVFTDGIYVDKLLSHELVLGAWHADNVLRLGRIMKAVSLSTAELEVYYDTVKRNLRDDVLTTAHLYPDPVPAVEGSHIPTLTYLGKLSRDGDCVDILQATSADRPYSIYLAKMLQDHGVSDEPAQEVDVVVKFTWRYNERAHRVLAEKQLAPTLYYCSRVLGGLYMVVMDHIKGKSIYLASIPLDYSPIYVDLEKAVELLHDENLVFGDLRIQNAICKPEGGAMLVDFDWVGEHGVDRYPASLNDDPGNRWAVGVGRRTIMAKAHDEFMLGQIKKFLEGVKGT